MAGKAEGHGRLRFVPDGPVVPRAIEALAFAANERIAAAEALKTSLAMPL
jgi:hypothetical protein